MKVALLAVLAVTPLAAGCSDDTGTPIDAAVIDQAVDAVDAPPGACGADYQFTGEYIDWDSTPTSFLGVVGATFTVVGDPARTASAAPNGRIILCLPRTGTVTLDVTQNNYVAAQFIADPAVFAPAQTSFSIRGLKTAVRDARYDALMSGMTFDVNAGHVFVEQLGTPAALTLTGTGGAAAGYVEDGDADVTWTAGTTGHYVFFPNVAAAASGATATLAGVATGPMTIPMTRGKITYVIVR